MNPCMFVKVEREGGTESRKPSVFVDEVVLFPHLSTCSTAHAHIRAPK